MRGKKVLCVIPARGGSKGIKLKNIYIVKGKPLIFYTLDFVKKINFFDDILISTDNLEIKKVCEKYGFHIPFLRPKNLSGDKVSDISVLKHSVRKLEKYNKTVYQTVIMLPPTSPLRLNKDLMSGLKKFYKNKHDSLWSVSLIDKKYHPDKQLLLNKERLSYYSDKGKKIIARQQLGNTYIRNGIFYILDRKCILEKGEILGNKPGFYEIKSDYFNIDSLTDIRSFESYIKK